MSERALIALGSNLGDRRAYLASSLSLLTLRAGVRLRGVSRVEETAPLGSVAQGPFLNQMAAVEVTITPHVLLDALLRIERALGRVRGQRWGPRVIDLDLVRMGERRIADPRLTLPHPELPGRDFWRRAIAELEGAGVA